MERSISSTQERIKRAEEIYQRRKMQGDIRVPTSQVNTKSEPNYLMLKKIILQILICLFIYLIFYLIKNSNYIFSENVINKTREFLSYDINFQNIYNQMQDYYNYHIKAFLTNQEQDSTNETMNEITNEIENVVTNEQNIEETQIQTNTAEEGGMGGGEEGVALLENEIMNISEKEEKPLTQMEIDANYIKENFNIVSPLKGTITSRFGAREPTEIVSANHAGIDIAVNEGTIFTAAMDGIVTKVLGEGSYGNHVYIENNGVTTLYAHCKTIYVKVGETISQGQQIGEVGETGKATGPHLHFEIRRENRVVDPEYILTF